MTAKCDSTIQEAWYRVNSTAGEDVITSCPPSDRCGTNGPIWMNDTFPNEADGIVDRIMCASTLRDCCESQIQIQMKNCSTYNVYYLKQTPCPQAYCFGTRLVTTEAPPSTITTITSTIMTGTQDVNGTGFITTQVPSITQTTSTSAGMPVPDKDDDKEIETCTKLCVVLVMCFTIMFVALIVTISVFMYRWYKPSSLPPTRPYSGKTRPMPSTVQPASIRPLSPPPTYKEAIEDTY
ncbi:hypothetical protein FSP39_018320 [Pinctada imbricata]|uniref:UMOD/GP2/OIT3-like D8C domain-containing protein n=1 Tax=Pinctada imbricata TaxID=66713 RepID=A0AA88YPW4_PINIB|nr:hypothetical protein FSP39_018320 [Pinctada imbricata]